MISFCPGLTVSTVCSRSLIWGQFCFLLLAWRSHLHDDTHEQLVDVMSHTRRGLSKLDSKLYSQVTALPGLHQSAASKVGFVTYQDRRPGGGADWCEGNDGDKVGG